MLWLQSFGSYDLHLSMQSVSITTWGMCRVCDCMVVRFTSAFAISLNHRSRFAYTLKFFLQIPFKLHMYICLKHRYDRLSSWSNMFVWSIKYWKGVDWCLENRCTGKVWNKFECECTTKYATLNSRLWFRVREYLKFSVRHRTDRMQISASPTKKLVVLQFVKLLTTKDD